MRGYQSVALRQKIAEATIEVQDQIFNELIRRGIKCTRTSGNISANGFVLFNSYSDGLNVDEIAGKLRLQIKYDSTKRTYSRGWLKIATTYVLGEKFQLGKVCDKIGEILGDQDKIAARAVLEHQLQQNKSQNVEQAKDLMEELGLPSDSKLRITATDNITTPFDVALKFTHLTKFQVLALYAVIEQSGLLGNMEKVP